MIPSSLRTLFFFNYTHDDDGRPILINGGMKCRTIQEIGVGIAIERLK